MSETPEDPPAVRSTAPRGQVLVPPGTVLVGTYEIVEHLSSGGFGEVYRGRNIHNQTDTVAIKIILAALAHDEVALSLFQQESNALNRLAHDAIVRYRMFTVDPGLNRPCLVMDFVDGPSLGDRIDAGPLTQAEVLALILRLASGLEVAHRAEVVHRDLSPDNVILPDGRVETARIIDFGIAKMTTPGGRTVIGDKFAGKPGYVAPEQLGAFGGKVTGQADVYSLALVAAAAARGQPLDMGDSPAAAVMARMRVPDLAGIPEGVRGLLAAMLEPDPALRPQGMTAVIDAVLRLQGVQPGLSRRPEALQVSLPPGLAPAPEGQDRTARPAGVPLPTIVVAEGKPPGPLPMPPPPVPPPPARRGRARVWMLVLALVVGPVAGVTAWARMGLPLPAVLSRQVGTSTGQQIDWLDRHLLAGAGQSSCRHVQLRAPSDPAAQAIAMAGFAADPAVFAELRTAFATANGQPADLVEHRVNDRQCAILDFLATVRPPLITTSAPLRLSATVGPDGDLTGEIGGSADEQLTLMLLDPAGRLQNLSTRIAEETPEAGLRGFQLNPRRLSPPSDLDAWPADSVFVVIALGSEAPLSVPRLIPDNFWLPPTDLGRFLGLLAEEFGNQRRPVRVVLQAVPVVPR